MGQFENVQRGVIFTFFLYSIVILVFFIIKCIKNRVDIEAGVEDQDVADKYAQGKDDKPKAEGDDKKKEDGDISESKGKIAKEKPKPKPVESENNAESTMVQLQVKVTKPMEPQEDDPLVVKAGLKFRHHLMYHLPFFFPFALNIVTGTSYAFLLVLFFFVQVAFAIFNDLKIHRNCVENKVIKIIAESIGYVLTFFAWVNLWGATTNPMPFNVVKNI